VSNSEQKKNVLEKVKSSIFTTKYNKNFIKKYETKFSHALLVKELGKIENLIAQEANTRPQIAHLINQQKEMLFDSYQNGKSLFFYYLYGTMNYTNAVLTKLTTKSNDAEKLHKSCFEVKTKWLTTLECIKKTIENNSITDFDLSAYSGPQRESKMLEINYKKESLLIVTDSEHFNNLAKYAIPTVFSWVSNFKILTIDEYNESKEHADYIIYYSEKTDQSPIPKGRINTVCITLDIEKINKLKQGIRYFVLPDINPKITVRNTIPLICSTIHFCLSNHKTPVNFAKIRVCDDADFKDKSITLPIKNYILSSHLFYVCIDLKDNFRNSVAGNGTRGKIIFDQLRYKHIFYKLESKQEFETNLEEQNSLIKSLEKGKR
jgi:hypothetical protein